MKVIFFRAVSITSCLVDAQPSSNTNALLDSKEARWIEIMPGIDNQRVQFKIFSNPIPSQTHIYNDIRGWIKIEVKEFLQLI